MSVTPTFQTLQNLTRTVICVARNYVAHAKELNNAVPKDFPPIFLKPPSSIIPSNSAIKIPKDSHIDHEIELGVIIKKKGSNIPVESAKDYISGYFLGIDVTARDVQRKAAKSGMPWTVAKGYETFSVVSDVVPIEKVKDHSNLRLWLTNNGEHRHDGNTKNMIFSVEETISYVSNVFPLLPNDIIFTGTPEGVKRMDPGDIIEAGLEDGITGEKLVNLYNPVKLTDNKHGAQVYYLNKEKYLKDKKSTF